MSSTSVLAQSARSGADDILPRVRPGDEVPLSCAQEQLWFLQSLEPGLTAYNLPRTFRLRGPLDADALERAFQAIVDRHAILRTRFFERDGVVLQMIQAEADFVLEQVDLSRLPGAERDSVSRALVERTAQHVFDLGRAPALVARLARLSQDEHVLSVCLHHIVSDAWSNPILARDLGTAYAQAMAAPGPVRLPPPRLQYADYALWQRECLQRGELTPQLAYWNAHLGDEVPVLELPTDAERPARQGFRGALHGFALEPALAGALQAFCRSERCTPFVVLLAAWQMTLGWWSGQSDFAVGTPNAGRHRDELHDVMGFFITTQVFRARLAPQLSLRDICRRVRADAMNALQHADLPLELLLASRNVPRDPSRPPLFQVMFGVQMGGAAAEMMLGPTRAELVASRHTSAKFELSLDFQIDAHGALGQLEYNTDLFRPATAAWLTGVYLRLLALLLAEPDQPFGGVDLSGEADRDQLRDWGTNSQPWPKDEPVHRLIERRAREQPEAVALVHEHEVLCYGELEERANRLAHYLMRRGVRADARVGIALERGVPMIVGVLAVLKAGGAYVPLDPDYPSQRLAHMVEDSGLSLVLTQSSVIGRLPLEPRLQVLALDRLSVEGEGVHAPTVMVHPNNLAYLIYTSGSTGRPKGVGIEHHALARHAQEAVRFFGLLPSDRMLQFSTLNFDGFVEQMFAPLVAGAAIVLRGPALWDSQTFYRELFDKSISVVDLTTAYWHLLAQDFAAEVRTHGARSHGMLRQVHAGGEAMPPEALKAWREAGLGHVTLLNTYGPTEATVTATVLDCAAWLQEDARLPARMPIGEPLAGRSLWVLGSDLGLLPRGVPGELCIGGELLARGYLGRAGLTAERFIAAEDGQRLYRTGDLVRWNAEGQLEYLGRIDQQVKLRGFRIELGEIEAQLLAQPELREAVVVAQEGPSGTRLVAYVSAHAGQRVEPAELRTRLGTVLPDYMVPSAVVVLDALPLNANGKVDRKALPAAELASERAYEAPQGEAEQALAAIWSQVLGVERIGRHDNFFELGGDSILSLQIVARLRGAGWASTPRQLLERQSVAELAKVMVPAQAGSSGSTDAELASIPVLADRHRPEGLPLSHAQGRQWFLWQLAPSSRAYHIAEGFRLTGNVDVDVLRHAFQALVDRHESLRTRFLAREDGLASQVILRDWQIELPLIDLGDLDAGQREGAARARADALHAAPFDLCAGPPWRVALIRLSAAEHLLLVVMHHIISDGWSMQLIANEFVAHYRACLRGEPLQLPAPRLHYADYTDWQRRWLDAGERERQLAYWRGRLGETHEALRLSTDHPRVPGCEQEVGRCTVVLPNALAAGLQRVAQAHGTTRFTALLAGFQVLLHRYTGLEDIRLGMATANRHRPGTEGIVGFFVNTLVLPVRVEPGLRLQEALQRAHEAMLGAHQHQDLPFEELVDALQPERQAGQTPLFQIMVNHQRSRPGQEAGLPGLALQDYVFGERAAQFELTLDLFEDESGGVSATLRYAARLFERQTMERMATHYVELLRALAERPGQAVAAVPMMAGAEQAQLAVWGENEADRESGRLVAALVEAQARTRPDAQAVVCGDVQWSYRRLDAFANRLAHRLIALGVRPEVCVGIAMERSPEMVVGLLAVLKAGGAYVPLDPEYPPERLAYMVQDSAVALLLTQSHLRALLPLPLGVPVLELDALDLANEPTESPPVNMHGEHLAYVIYTSGSTGRPKGVNVTQRAMARLVDGTGFARLDGGVRMLQYAPLAFDASTFEIWGCLANGGVLVQAPPGRLSFEQLGRVIEAQRIDTAWLTAALFNQMLESCPGGLGRLRQLLSGGEAMSVHHARRALERFGSTTSLINGYGPTECTTFAACHRVRLADARAERVPLGRPIEGRRCRVLDARLQPVPQGVAGELYLGGIGLARGYLGRAGLTAERFIAEEDGQRLYRTGDLVRWNAEGQLEYLGRIDQQVKLRGFRIELGEIEAQLLAQPELREAVVVAQEGPSGTRLVAYVSAHAGQRVEPAELRTRLGTVLPDYMVPSAVVVLDALPLNANGKVDRKALPAAELASERAYEAPQGEAEQALAAIWSQVLGVGRIGRHDNFFELGGDSLLALKVIARVQSLEDPALKLSLPALMQKQTIAALQVAEAYEAAQRDHAASPPPAPVGVRRLNGGGRDAAAAAPLFCIAPGLRSALDYRPLARHLDGRCEVYGLSLGEAGRRDGLASMAADLAEAIRRTRPAGPVALLGWSLGAPMALHVAAQLEAWGRDVVFVGLVDSYVATGRFDSGLWYDDLRRFVEEVATDRAGKARVGEVLDRFESVRHADGEAMDRAVRGILGELDIDAGGLDIVARASAARRYYAAIADAPPLAGLKAAPSLYWCRRRGEEEKAKLRQELPLAPRTVVQIDADHQGIVRHEVLFTEVARELVVAGGSRARWHSEPGGGGAG